MTRPETPSRSRRKRESQALQELGERLVRLEEDDLSQIPLPEELASAVQLARRIKERGGHRRQLQYIGKLMRGIDATDIVTALAVIESERRRGTSEFHLAEEWRNRILREGATAVDDLCAEHQIADRAKLASLLQDATAESKTHHPPRASRELFRYLRDEVFGSKTS